MLQHLILAPVFKRKKRERDTVSMTSWPTKKLVSSFGIDKYVVSTDVVLEFKKFEETS